MNEEIESLISMANNNTIKAVELALDMKENGKSREEIIERVKELVYGKQHQ